MTTEDFTNSIDGTINDFTTGVTNAVEFRDSILKTLIAVATPHLERKPKPFVPTTWQLEINSTCSGAWFAITEECIDPKTKEEWKNEIATTGTVLVFDHEKFGKDIAATYKDAPEYWKTTEHYSERLANAKLIAASPDMLQALLAAQQCIRDMVDVYGRGASMLVLDEAVKDLKNDAGKLVNAAIKKATE
ncbi:hypothetical protein [Spirosoma sp.]|uniref:hypothetical protein n=1 Tax=Spirosoma sp. TaxID=1899569 RepID=UPI0026174261|nr:hypothetical protein [Spirosoma sp.]MCX6217578.1 hypothetical protein [Spirosoma sp.]